MSRELAAKNVLTGSRRLVRKSIHATAASVIVPAKSPAPIAGFWPSVHSAA